MNAALLVKWIFRFGNEDNRLWSWVVKAKSGTDPRSLILGLGGQSRKSSLVRVVRSLLDRNEQTSRCVYEGFRILSGNGQKTEFWSDDWTGQGVFRIQFPRIFAVACYKSGPVSSFGQWVGDAWS